MPHIALNSAEPGIRGLIRYRPETAPPLSELTEVLLWGSSTLTGRAGTDRVVPAYPRSARRLRRPISQTAPALQMPLRGRPAVCDLKVPGSKLVL